MSVRAQTRLKIQSRTFYFPITLDDNTPFDQLATRVTLNPTFIRLRFSGVSLDQIAKQLHVSKNLAISRDKVLRLILHDKFPSLYTWWSSLQTSQGHRLASVLDVQKEIFLNWLKEMAQTKTIKCPNCGVRLQRLNKVKTMNRPHFYCHKCQTYTNLLKGTTLFHAINLERWLQFAEFVFKRRSSTFIEKQLDPTYANMPKWRSRFIEQAKAMKLNALAKWLK